jgi:hypothetical protein
LDNEIAYLFYRKGLPDTYWHSYLCIFWASEFFWFLFLFIYFFGEGLKLWLPAFGDAGLMNKLTGLALNQDPPISASQVGRIMEPPVSGSGVLELQPSKWSLYNFANFFFLFIYLHRVYGILNLDVILLFNFRDVSWLLHGAHFVLFLLVSIFPYFSRISSVNNYVNRLGEKWLLGWSEYIVLPYKYTVPSQYSVIFGVLKEKRGTKIRSHIIS